VAISIQENRGIASLSRPVIDPDSADQVRRYRRLTANTEPSIRNSCGVKGADTSENGDASPKIVRHDCADDTSRFVTDERMTTNRGQTGSSKRLEKHTLGPSLEFEAGSIGERDGELTCERQRRRGEPPVCRRLPPSGLILRARPAGARTRKRHAGSSSADLRRDAPARWN
jgi:hypothetical protein